MLSFRYEEEKELNGSSSLADLPVYLDLAKILPWATPLHHYRRYKSAKCSDKQKKISNNSFEKLTIDIF